MMEEKLVGERGVHWTDDEIGSFLLFLSTFFTLVMCTCKLTGSCVRLCFLWAVALARYEKVRGTPSTTRALLCKTEVLWQN
jgi:hypothetical protein